MEVLRSRGPWVYDGVGGGDAGVPGMGGRMGGGAGVERAFSSLLAETECVYAMAGAIRHRAALDDNDGIGPKVGQPTAPLVHVAVEGQPGRGEGTQVEWMMAGWDGRKKQGLFGLCAARP